MKALEQNQDHQKVLQIILRVTWTPVVNYMPIHPIAVQYEPNEHTNVAIY